MPGEEELAATLSGGVRLAEGELGGRTAEGEVEWRTADGELSARPAEGELDGRTAETGMVLGRSRIKPSGGVRKPSITIRAGL